MELAEVALSIGGGVVSGTITALVFSFFLGRKYQKIEDKLEALAEADEKLVDKLDKIEGKLQKVEDDAETMTKENNQSWQDINRSLGQIEGMLSGGALPPPPLPRKSRP